MYRSHTCGELRIENVGQKVTLAGWVQRSRKLGGMTFIDLRDRYGITQLVLEADADAALVEKATSLGREYVIQAIGEVVERQSKNPKMGTGDIEIRLEAINILNKSAVPPFTIEDESDGGEDLRAKFRYLDLRRNPLQKALALRHRLAHEVRNYLDAHNFMEIENSVPDQVHSGGSPRLCRAFQDESGTVLRPSAVSSDLQAAADGRRLRPLLPDRALLP